MPNGRSRFNFSRFFGILNFYQFFNVLHLFEHGPDPDFRKLPKIPKIGSFWVQKYEIRMKNFKICFCNFFLRSKLMIFYWGFFFNCNRSKVVHISVNHIFRFSIFPGFPYINSLRKRGGKSKIQKISKLQNNSEIALVDGF